MPDAFLDGSDLPFLHFDVIVNGLFDKPRLRTIRGGGKWGIDGEDVSWRRRLFYVLLRYHHFENPTSLPDVFVVPARAAEAMKEPWFNGSAIYCSNQERCARLERFQDAWRLI